MKDISNFAFPMSKFNFPKRHLILLHMSALLFGGTALFSKLLPISANDIILSRSLFSCLLLGLFLLIISPSKLKIKTGKDIFTIFFSGLLFGIHLFTYFYAIKVSTIGIGVISLFTFPMITTLIEPFVLKTVPKFKDVFMGILILIGVFFIIAESNFNQNSLLGVGLGIVSALSYSLRNLLQKYKLSDYSPISMLFYQLLITLFIMMPFSTIDYSQTSNFNFTLLIILSVVFTIIPHLAVIESLKKYDARSVSVILTLQVFYAILFAYFLFNENFKPSIVIGGTLVILVVGYETIRIQLNSKFKRNL